MRFPIASQVALFIFRANEKYVLHFMNVSLGIEVDGSCLFSSILPGTTNVLSLTPKLCFIYGKKELEVAKRIELLNQRELAGKVGSTTRWCETVADCSTPHKLSMLLRAVFWLRAIPQPQCFTQCTQLGSTTKFSDKPRLYGLSPQT